MSQTHKTVKSPNPKYRCLIVSVAEENFAKYGGVLPTEGTLYSSGDFSRLFGRDYQKSFAGYVYVGQGEDFGPSEKFPEGGGTLHFAPNIPAAEYKLPFRTFTEFKKFYWDPILQAIVFIKDPLPESRGVITGTGAGSAQQNTYSPREIYIPGGDIGSLFTFEEFFAPVKFPIPFYQTPVPSSVTYAIPGASGGFPNCLHEKIVIPNLESGAATYVSGTVSAVGGQITGQIFPETNVTEWQYQVVSHTQQFQMGYYAVKISVVPPEQPETIIQA